MNFHAMLPRLHALLSANARALSEIAEDFQDARDLPKCLGRLGLEHHPGVLELKHVWRNPHRSRSEALLKSNGILPIIFHSDGPTLFQDLSAFSTLLKTGHDSGNAIENAELTVEPLGSPTVPPRVEMPLLDSFMCKYATQFAVQLMKQASRNVVFSLGPRLSCAATEVEEDGQLYRHFTAKKGASH